mmetsp:Transcript_31059/g.58237  ORF Transcript_31059/g.58237 Transcript_31059/m.58237 type:complete len:352 (+) Transcript_31059:66-1121(+)
MERPNLAFAMEEDHVTSVFLSAQKALTLMRRERCGVDDIAALVDITAELQQELQCWKSGWHKKEGLRRRAQDIILQTMQRRSLRWLFDYDIGERGATVLSEMPLKRIIATTKELRHPVLEHGQECFAMALKLVSDPDTHRVFKNHADWLLLDHNRLMFEGMLSQIVTMDFANIYGSLDFPVPGQCERSEGAKNEGMTASQASTAAPSSQHFPPASQSSTASPASSASRLPQDGRPKGGASQAPEGETTFVKFEGTPKDILHRWVDKHIHPRKFVQGVDINYFDLQPHRGRFRVCLNVPSWSGEVIQSDWCTTEREAKTDAAKKFLCLPGVEDRMTQFHKNPRTRKRKAPAE